MKQIGILGGGQLGMMILEAYKKVASNQQRVTRECWKEVSLKFLEKSKDCSVGMIDPEVVVVGDFKDFEDVYNFGKDCEVVSVEIEHVNIQALEKLESEGVAVHPSSQVLKVVQDKGLQKQFYQDNGIPTSAFHLIETQSEIEDCFPIVQKMRRGGYDGQGVAVLRSRSDLETKAFDVPSVMEAAVDIDKEISVIVVRSSKGEVVTFPSVEMAFDPETNLVTELFSPSSLTQAQDAEAKRIAVEVSETLQVVGLLAVELFLDKTGHILVNEIAPRPHNSGHHTIEGNETSQFEQHLRAISGMDLGSTEIIKPAIMINVLGAPGFEGPAVYEGLEEVEALEGVYVHLYGKKETRPARKMGHITILGDSVQEAREKAQFVGERLRVVAA